MATQMYFSCGDSTADLKTGSPTVTISGTTATFSTAQTGNIGVGDEVTYDTSNKCYIVGKTSTTVWTVRSATGGTPTSGTGVTVNSIKHAFASLNAALAGWHGASYFNSTDLVTKDTVMHIACYRDSADDTTAVGDTTAVTTDSTRYLRIFTPTDTATQCNASQRHRGKVDTSRYRIVTGNGGGGVNITGTKYIRVEGLQIKCTNSQQDGATNSRPALRAEHATAGGATYIEQNVIQLAQYGADWWGIRTGYSSSVNRVSNNIVIGKGSSDGNYGIYGNGTLYAYNNTFYNIGTGGFFIWEYVTLKNNLLATVGAAWEYNPVYTSVTQSYSASTGTVSGTGSRSNQTFTFVDAANGDLHLTSGDTGAKGYGTDLSADANYAITLDIDGATRSGTWDIGADQTDPPPAGTTYYLLSSANADGWGDVQVGGTAPSAATMATGWTVGTTASGNYSKMAYGSERAANTFSTTAVPGTAPDNTLKDAFRIGPMTGTFAAGTWTISVPVIAVTAQGGADGRIRVRLFKSANADGSSATEVTSGAVTLSTVTDVTTGAQQVSTGTVSLGEITLSNQYLFCCLAWEITGAAS